MVLHSMTAFMMQVMPLGAMTLPDTSSFWIFLLFKIAAAMAGQATASVSPKRARAQSVPNVGSRTISATPSTSKACHPALPVSSFP